MLHIAVLASFLAVACLVWLVLRIFLRTQANGTQRPLFPGGVPQGGGGVALAPSLAVQLPASGVDSDELDKDLRRAGRYQATARRDFLFRRNTMVLLTLLVTGCLAVYVGPEHQNLVLRIVAAGVLVAVICWGLPRVLLALAARRRMQRIVRGLPDTLDMVGMCLYGGLPLLDALWYVSREIGRVHGDLASELLIIQKQAELNSIEFAFQQFSARIDDRSVVALSSLVVQNQWLGTSLVESVREYSDGLRNKRRQLADEHSGKAQLRMLLPATLCLVPATLMMLWGPAALDLWQFLQRLAAPIVLRQ